MDYHKDFIALCLYNQLCLYTASMYFFCIYLQKGCIVVIFEGEMNLL